MSEANQKQKEFWSGKGGSYWVEKQKEMDVMLEPLGNAALSLISLEDTSNILDIGCGCGSTTIEIASNYPTAKVLGADISVPMIEQARRLAEKEGISNIEFKIIDIQEDDIDSNFFDIVFSRFGIMFFENPSRAFKKLYSSLKDNGNIGFVCWQSPSLNPWQSISMEITKKYVDLPSPPIRSPGPFAFQEQEYVRSLLEDSGFKSVCIKDHQQEIVMFSGRKLEEAARDYLSINPVVKEMLSNLDEGVYEQVISELARAFERFYSDKGLLFPSATWLVTATK